MNPLTNRLSQSYLSVILRNPIAYIFNYPQFEAKLNENFEKRIEEHNLKQKSDFEEIFRNTKEYVDKSWSFVIYQ